VTFLASNPCNPRKSGDTTPCRMTGVTLHSKEIKPETSAPPTAGGGKGGEGLGGEKGKVKGLKAKA